MPSNTILVTRSAGFIGSHTCVALTQAGFEPLILDDFSNSSERVLQRLHIFTRATPTLVKGDMRDGGRGPARVLRRER